MLLVLTYRLFRLEGPIKVSKLISCTDTYLVSGKYKTSFLQALSMCRKPTCSDGRTKYIVFRTKKPGLVFVHECSAVHMKLCRSFKEPLKASVIHFFKFDLTLYMNLPRSLLPNAMPAEPFEEALLLKKKVYLEIIET